jgi:hypothetical protein
MCLLRVAIRTKPPRQGREIALVYLAITPGLEAFATILVFGACCLVSEFLSQEATTPCLTGTALRSRLDRPIPSLIVWLFSRDEGIHMSTNRFLAACALLLMVLPPTPALSQQEEASTWVNIRKHGVTFDYANVSTPSGGVAGQDVAFVGDRSTGRYCAVKTHWRASWRAASTPNGFASRSSCIT